MSSSVASLARLVASQFDVLASERGFTYVIDASTTCEAEIDPAQVQRIAVKLLSNAFKFTPSGGRVRLTVGADAAHDRVVIAVADNGPG